ncbi:ABC transporter permease [Jiella mangrovi]|uniref:ABC transporter permease n=1 Tax=Jiella mangrovi TaxID=2821407 RepID=A0ABS4BE60_9HYPH|nr:ABC transporter permease [Jiella mangrovi]MBP0615028.1 ABC transporter permease [Jiella mangrovi]
MTRPLRASSVLGLVYAGLLYGFIFLPVAVLVLFSFHRGRFPIPPFNGPSLRWYDQILSDGRLMDALLNSLTVGVLSSLASVLLGFLAAYGIARHRPPGSRLLSGFLMAPLTVSYLIIGMGLLITFNAAGMPKSLLATGLGHIVINLPLCFAIIYSQLTDDQANIERSARDLGASEAKVLLLVTAPMIWPALFASFFLAFTFSWDEFVIAFLLTRFDVTLPVEIWSLLRSGLNPKTNAIGTLVFGVSILLVFVIEAVVFGRRRAST